MSLGLEGSLEAQLALETVIQVGPGSCALPCPAALEGVGEEYTHVGCRVVWWWGAQGPWFAAPSQTWGRGLHKAQLLWLPTPCGLWGVGVPTPRF